jgi:hypothetical protein
MPYLLIGHNLLRFNLLQCIKAEFFTGFFKSLIQMKKNF